MAQSYSLIAELCMAEISSLYLNLVNDSTQHPKSK